jgi:MFS family permease
MTTLTEPGTVTTRRSSRLMWAILGLVLLADALDVIDATVTNIAAPTIAGELNGGVSLIKWLGPAYMLAMGVLLVVGGRLGDKFGQRRLFLIGMGGFTLASAVAGFSPDPALLIAARVAQGAFGALLIPQGMAIMTKAFDREMLAKAFGLFGPVLGLSSVGGPVLASWPDPSSAPTCSVCPGVRSSSSTSSLALPGWSWPSRSCRATATATGPPSSTAGAPACSR